MNSIDKEFYCLWSSSFISYGLLWNLCQLEIFVKASKVVSRILSILPYNRLEHFWKDFIIYYHFILEYSSQFLSFYFHNGTLRCWKTLRNISLKLFRDDFPWFHDRITWIVPAEKCSAVNLLSQKFVDEKKLSVIITYLDSLHIHLQFYSLKVWSSLPQYDSFRWNIFITLES